MNHYSIIEYKYPLAADYYYNAEHARNDYCPLVSVHTHNHYEFYIFLEGKIQFLIDNHIYNIKKGEVIIVPPYHTHNLIPVDKSHPYERMYLNATENCLGSFQFQQHSLMKPLREIEKTGIYCYSIHDSSDFERIVNAIQQMKENKFKSFYNKEMLNRACILQIVSIINKYIMTEIDAYKIPETDSLLSQTIHYLSKNFTKKISIEKLCTDLLTNRQTVTKLFRESTSLTIHNYITLLRISYAKQLIVSGEKPSKIYSSCGFEDYSTFYRAFKKLEKLTPREFETYLSENNKTDSLETRRSKISSSLNELTAPSLQENISTTENNLSPSVIKEYFYINSYLLKHFYRFIKDPTFVGDYLRNNSLNFLDTNKYALPGYLPPAGFSAQESETLLYITPGSSYSYPTYTPISNNFVLTLTGTASEPSCLQIQSENHLIDNLFWDTGQNTVSTESFYLNRGYAGLTIKLMSGYVNVTDIYVDIAPLCAKCSANIMASSVENGKSTLSLRNKNKDAVWSPAPGDAAPWIEFQFAHLLYLDHFTVTGETSQVKGFEIQTRTSEDRWSTVYHGTEIISCQAIYIQGTKSIKGTCFRILFTKLTGPIEISEIKLSPYINWAREDTGVSVQLSKESGISPDTIINGDRINPGWITVGGQTAVLTFSSPHTIDTVTVIGIQESVQEEKTGVIPDSDMTSAFVQRQYTLSYLNTSGKWVRSASYVTMPDGPDTQSQRKVINRFVLEKTVTAAAIQAEVGTSYWTRVIELEASESYELYETT